MRSLHNTVGAPNYEKHITAVALSSDGTRIAAGSGDCRILWSSYPFGGPAPFRFPAEHTQHISCVAMSSDVMRIVSGSWDNTIKVWGTTTGVCLRTLHGHTKGVSSLAFLSVRQIVSGSWDHTLKVWDITSGACVRTLYGHVGDVLTVAVSLARQYFVSGSTDETIMVWKLDSGIEGIELVSMLGAHLGHVPTSVAVSPDGQHIVSAGKTKIKVWRLNRLEDASPWGGWHVRTIIFESENQGFRFRSLAISPEGSHIVAGSSDRTVKLSVWDLASGVFVRTLSGHTREVSSVAVSADGRHIVSGSTDCTIKIWDRYQRLPHALIRNRLCGTNATVSADQPPEVRKVLHFVYGGDEDIGPIILDDLFPLVIKFLVMW